MAPRVAESEQARRAPVGVAFVAEVTNVRPLRESDTRSVQRSDAFNRLALEAVGERSQLCSPMGRQMFGRRWLLCSRNSTGKRSIEDLSKLVVANLAQLAWKFRARLRENPCCAQRRSGVVSQS